MAARLITLAMVFLTHGALSAPSERAGVNVSSMRGAEWISSLGQISKEQHFNSSGSVQAMVKNDELDWFSDNSSVASRKELRGSRSDDAVSNLIRIRPHQNAKLQKLDVQSLECKDGKVANPFPNHQDGSSADLGACLTKDEAGKAFGDLIKGLCSKPEGHDQRKAQDFVLSWLKVVDANELVDGRTPLQLASQCGLWRTVETLLVQGSAKADVLSDAGCSPLDYAINGGNTLVKNHGQRERFLKTMELLVCKGADKCDTGRGCSLVQDCEKQPLGSPTEKFAIPTQESCTKGGGDKSNGSFYKPAAAVILSVATSAVLPLI